MKLATILLISVAGLIAFRPGQAQTTSFTSPETRTTLLELYTSEGCSSCPPADRWLSRLKQNPRLWETLFPIAFHVDYWNYLGWNDQFSDAAYSARQQNYADHGYARTVYTPGFFQNGREWRGWFNRQNLKPDDGIKVGTLSATITPRQVEAEFKPDTEINATRLNIAMLGFNKTTQIQAGENRGKKLHHDFVALAQHQYPGENNHWRITDSTLLNQLHEGTAIVLWITQENDPTPIQTTGGWISE